MVIIACLTGAFAAALLACGTEPAPVVEQNELPPRLRSAVENLEAGGYEVEARAIRAKGPGERIVALVVDPGSQHPVFVTTAPNSLPHPVRDLETGERFRTSLTVFCPRGGAAGDAGRYVDPVFEASRICGARRAR